MTHTPVPVPKCKLIISSFNKLPDLLDCLLCTRNAMSIVLLLQMIGGGISWGVVNLYSCMDGGTGGAYHLIVFVFLLSFCIFLSHVLSPFI